MSDDRTTESMGQGRQPAATNPADKVPTVTPEVQAQARALFEKAGVVKAGDQPSHVKRKDENDSTGRDKHRHIKDTQQESLVAPPAVGYGSKAAGVEQPASERTTAEPEAAQGKTVDGKGPAPAGAPPTPAELAAKYRGQLQQARITPESAREQSPGPPRATPAPAARGERGGRGE